MLIVFFSLIFVFILLQQIGHGKLQTTLLIVCGFVVGADLSELMALILSSKSAQFEFCVDDTQKSWIGK